MDKRRGRGERKKTESENCCCDILCKDESLKQFWRHGRTECDVHQNGENSIALENSRERVLAKAFSFNIGDVEGMCQQKSEASWKGYTNWESQRETQGMRLRTCDRLLTACDLFSLGPVTGLNTNLNSKPLSYVDCSLGSRTGCTWSHLHALKTSFTAEFSDFGSLWLYKGHQDWRITAV